MKIKMIDGISIEFSDQGIEAVSKLENQINDLSTNLEKANVSITDNDKKVADLTASNETLKGELDAEKAKAMDGKAIDTLVANRVALIDQAKKLHKDIETDGKSDLEIKKASILHDEKEIKLEGKTEEYINAFFDALITKIETNDDLADALNDKNIPDDKDVVAKARQKFIDEQRNAWNKKDKE